MRISSIELVCTAAGLADLPKDARPEVAFVGRSNVGKSSLLNYLVGRKKLAYTSRTPGKTQTINFYLVNDEFYLVDLPGLGYARTSKAQRTRWQKWITRYVTQRETLSLICHLVDSRHPPTPIDEFITDAARVSGVGYVVVLTKFDKLNQKQQQQALRRMNRLLLQQGLEAPIVPTSTLKPRGKDEIWRWVTTIAL